MRDLWRRLRVLLNRGRFEDDLTEEMAFHLEMEAEARRQSGAADEDARVAAQRQFGNATSLRDQSRDVWGWLWLETLLQDVKFALRLMRLNRAFTAMAVLTLALGIGANSAVFSLLDAVVLHPLPYPEPDRLYMLWTVEGKSQRGHHSSYPDFREWQQQSKTFEGMGAFHGTHFNVTGAPDAENVFGIACTPGLLEVLGISPIVGRPIAATDGLRVAVITSRLWVERYGEDRAVVGKTIRMDGDDYLVVGVLPRTFHFQPRLESEPDVFVPLEPVPSRTSWFLRVVGRLRNGVTEEQAQAEMNGIARRIVQANTELDRRQGIKVDPMHRYVVQDAGTIALLLAGAVGFLLLIACANVANLLLSRGAGRDRELTIRVALGANRIRLVRQLLTESVLTALVGGGLGLVLAFLSLPLLASMAPAWTSFFSRVQDNGVHLNLSVLGFTGAISVLSAILFGIVPALKSTRPIGSSAGRRQVSRSSSALVAVEVALSFVLLAGAGLMLNTLYRLLSVNPGFRTDALLTMSVSLPEKQYDSDESRAVYVARALDRLNQLPGVRSAAIVTALPLTGEYSTIEVEIDGTSRRSELQSVSSGYFRTMEIPVLSGRDLTNADRPGAPPVAVVNRAFARRFLAGAPVIGRTVTVFRMSMQHLPGGIRVHSVPTRVEVVGVVGDVNQMGLDAESQPEIDIPYPQRAIDSPTFVVRAAEGVPPGSLVAAARAELHRLDLNLPVTDVWTMDDWIRRSIAPSRFVCALVGVFALVAVALAAFGIYGVVAHSVSRRTHEIAVRLALGARPASVIRLVTIQHLTWVAAGITGGVVGAVSTTKLLSRYLYGVQPTDTLTYAVAAVTLLCVALAADVVPASRVTRIQPAAVLKRE